ncbi:HNH endonuclease [Bifidobacterium tibiigranuli]|jgi:5-methylcytosine-specific restriction endonuclease McrA|uniref:HNH endonuclease n=1 Tax=Bifidobacterium tibiigranuli TaxID=2172043 RepID=UPI0034C5F1DC
MSYRPGPDREPTGRERQRLLRLVCPTGSVCALCGKPIVFGLRPRHPLGPSIDHILPRSLGGTWAMGNLQPAHYGCNSAKQNRIQRIESQNHIRSRNW